MGISEFSKSFCRLSENKNIPVVSGKISGCSFAE